VVEVAAVVVTAAWEAEALMPTGSVPESWPRRVVSFVAGVLELDMIILLV